MRIVFVLVAALALGAYGEGDTPPKGIAATWVP